MSKLLRVRPVVVVVCAIGLLSAAVGVGLAATRSGTIHACANKKSGVLRLATHCMRAEERVSWSITGPRGAQGLRGAQGAQGAQGSQGQQGQQGTQGPPGPRGPSDAYTEYRQDLTVPAAAGNAFNLGSVSLPAGSFMVFGRASVLNNANVVKGVTCELGPPGANSGYPIFATDEAHLQGLPVGAEQTMTLLGPVDLSSGAGDVELDCSLAGAVGSGSLTFTDIQVSAIQVGTLNFPKTTTPINPCPPGTADGDGDGDQVPGGVDDGDGCL